VPGGGVALLRAKNSINKTIHENSDIQAGYAIVLKALEAPIRQIVENAGVEGSIVVGKILENKSDTFGFNAQTEEYVDMIKAGIVDPTKVVRTALQDAASVASLLITTEAMVADAPKRDGGGGPGGMPGGGMGGMGGMDF
jgi:chaperonin GroEL